METGDRLITGQVIENVAPVAECIREVAALPLPDVPVGGIDGDPMHLPGGAGLTADPTHIRRGIGWGVAIKNLMYSEAFDDYSTARCRLADGVASLKFAAVEVGQGFVVLAQQIARTVLGVDDVLLEPIDTSIGSAGSTSASRQTWMSGGAIDGACRLVRERLFEHVGARHDIDPVRLAIDGRDRRRHPGHAADSSRPSPPPESSSTRPSNTTTDRPRISTRTARATATRRSPSSPTGQSSTSTRNSDSSRSSRWRPPKTSESLSTR